MQSIHSRDIGDFDKYSSNEKPQHNNSIEKYEKIEEVDRDLEETGKFGTAKFGKTYDKKTVKISTNQEYINPNFQVSAKTPHIKPMQNVSPIKVSPNLNLP